MKIDYTKIGIAAVQKMTEDMAKTVAEQLPVGDTDAENQAVVEALAGVMTCIGFKVGYTMMMSHGLADGGRLALDLAQNCITEGVNTASRRISAEQSSHDILSILLGMGTEVRHDS